MADANPRGYTASFPYASPLSLAELRGPTSGTVTVPAYVDPRPGAEFVVQEPTSLRALYGAVVRAGTLDDQRALLDGALLAQVWMSLTLPGVCRELWESRIPELGRA